jgi:adenosyl cobinamide kinase/adenosyl cobinamide phosphate guanylyltransferase
MSWCLKTRISTHVRQREESIAKRRNFQPVEDELESEDEGENAGGPLQDTLPTMLAQIMTNNTETQLDATMKFRK